MDFLPIKFLRNEDKDRVDYWLIKLASLQKIGIPVLEGIVIFPPNFKEELRRVFIIDEVSFKNRRNALKSNFKTPPEFFIDEVQKFTRRKEIKDLWVKLIEQWFFDIEKISKEKGYSPSNFNLLKGIPLFFSERVTASGTVSVSKDFSFQESGFDTKINVEKGKLESKHLKELDYLAIKAEKILGLGFTFRWVLEEKNHQSKIYFTSIINSSRSVPAKVNDYKIHSIEEKEGNVNFDFPVKIFIDILPNEVLENAGGLILDDSKFDAEESLKLVIQFSEKNPKSSVVFQFSENDLRKTKDLKIKANNFLFLKNKKKLLNVAVGLPPSRSVEDLLRVKRDLAVLNISRKGSLKFWVNISFPSNIIDLENFALAGIDGVILNLDLLFKNFFVLDDFQKVNREKIETFIKFLDEGLRTLKKLKIPVIADGELVDNDEVLKYLISKGVYGIAVSAKRHQVFLMDLPWIHLQAQKNLLF